MNSSSHKFLFSLIAGLVIGNSSPLLADENNASQPDQNSPGGGYLKVGYGYKFESTPYHDEKNGGALFVSGRYQFQNGIYFEASHGANELNFGKSLGYNFYNTEHWSFDLHALQAHGGTSIGITTDDPGNEETGLRHFRMDGKSTHMLGLRTTGTYGQTSLQFVIAPYSFNREYDDGLFASAWLARSWQIKNWELYASAGLNYRSEEIINYYYATSQELVEFGAPAYQADGGFDITGQVGVSYPISKDILFESYLRYTDISDSISDSPVMQIFGNLDDRSENVTEFGILVSYVF